MTPDERNQELVRIMTILTDSGEKMLALPKEDRVVSYKVGLLMLGIADRLATCMEETDDAGVSNVPNLRVVPNVGAEPDGGQPLAARQDGPVVDGDAG